jgi:hypothetical protein
MNWMKPVAALIGRLSHDRNLSNLFTYLERGTLSISELGSLKILDGVMILDDRSGIVKP